MKKVFLLLVMLTLLVPTMFALYNENYVANWTGNNTDLYVTIIGTNQTTVNPGIGDNITYVTVINITAAGPAANFNFTGFNFYLPDNRTSSVLTDFTLANSTGAQVHVENASAFTKRYRNYVTFLMGGAEATCGNASYNGTLFNITWVLRSPITQTKLGETLNGRTYTETWNITNLASNMSIFNATLNITPNYWHTRIGNPFAPTFNGTEKGYLATLTDMSVHTSLNMSYGGFNPGRDYGAINLLQFGSGWGTLSVSYDGPILDPSSGKGSSAAVSTIPVVTQTNLRYWMIGLIGVLAIGVSVVVLIVVSKKK